MWQLMAPCDKAETTKFSGWVGSVASETVTAVELKRLKNRH